jgi:hypothetical protein
LSAPRQLRVSGVRAVETMTASWPDAVRLMRHLR